MNIYRFSMVIIACWVNAGEWIDAAEQDLRVRRVDSWTNLFAGKPVSMACEVSSLQTGDATLSWSLVVSGGVIARGEKGVTLNADRTEEVAWEIDMPEVKAGLIAPATLQLAVRRQGGSPPSEPVETLIGLSIFSPDATVLRSEWLRSLDIVLYDPARRTSNAFERAGVPCRVVDDPQCGGLTAGLILYGESLEAARLEAVWTAAVAAAAAGRRVLVMASPGATVPMEGLLASSTDSLRSVSLKRTDIIRELDPRLDATAWSKPGRLVASSLHWRVLGEQPCVEFRDNAEGWQWLDVRHRSGGRLIWLGFGLVESWDATPTARYLLLKVLEDLATDKPVVEGKHNEN